MIGASISRCCGSQIDNGYDAFAIDNSRTTESDQSGRRPPIFHRDFRAHSTYSGLGSTTLTTIATYADTTVNYGFDGDWGNPDAVGALHL